MNRRGFLGALLAAPMAAPVVAKELASGGRLMGMAEAAGVWLPLRVGEVPSQFELSPVQFEQFSAALDDATEPNPQLQELMRGPPMTIGDPPPGMIFNDALGWMPGTPTGQDLTPIRGDECRCPACTAPVPLHPLQAITDAPPLVPEPPCHGLTGDQMHRAALDAGYVPLREYVEQAPTYCTPVGESWCKSAVHTCGMCPVVPRPSQVRRTILAFTGLAGSGKTTAAKHLVDHHGFARVRFAGPLKDMMRALGLTETEIEGDRKEVPCDLLGGRTPRYAMQTIGTEWGRDIIAPDLWIRAWRAAVDRLPPGTPVVCDDCRFPNEAEAVRALGGELVRIVRPGAGTASVHSSEGQALNEAITISNVGTLADLAMDLDHLLTSQVKVGERRGS